MANGVLVSTNGGVRVGSSGGVRVTNAAGACPSCACGPTLGPCCTASFPCEITPATTPRQLKTWWNVTASGKRIVFAINPSPPPASCVGGAFSGTYSGTSVFDPLVLAATGANATAQLGGSCEVNRIVHNQTVLTFAGTVTGNLSPGGGSESQVSHSVATTQPQSGGGWAFQPSPFYVNPARKIVFRWDVIADSTQIAGGYEESNQATVGIEVRLLNGVATLQAFGAANATTILPGSFGTCTPFLVKEGNCILGAGASFSLTFAATCINPNTFQSESLGPLVITGSVATALCGLAVGCTAPGSVCASTTVPGAPGGGGGGAGTLEDQLDAALFS